jgi:type VI secretion system protein ImpE
MRPLPPKRPGTVNGEKFRSIEDIDPRIGPRLEVFIAGEYVWLPFAHIGSLTIGTASLSARSVLWGSATVTAGPAMQGKEFGEVLLPILYPFSRRSPAGRSKAGTRDRFGFWPKKILSRFPYGQKLFVLDEERSIAILEIRSLQFDDSIPQS